MKYTYGNKNASNNRVGRLMLQEDGSGAQEFFYGRLGEMTKVRRTLIIPNQAIATYVTQWKYDSWNRLEEMIYPDEEKITYSYNTAGLLESVKGEKAYSYNYVNKLGYDKFEQRIYMKYCNGAETNYTYDPQRRRLENLMVTAPSGSPAGGGLILDNRYSYDKVDNVLAVVNSATPPTGAGGLTMGGQMNHTYNYDGLYRLTSANGTYTGASNTPSGGRGASYTLEMQYDNLHNITGKKQHIEQKGIQFDGVLKAGYELSYNYENNPFQISTLQDDNYRTEGQNTPNDLTKKEHAYEYDLNGNLIYVNTSREKKDGTLQEKNNERKLLWDEENRLEAIDDNGFVSNYWYDAAGERTVKTSGESQEMYVNSVFSGGDTQTANFTAYVNPYLVVSKGGQYTKHIYIGSQRIVSKLGDLNSYGSDPRRIEYAGANVDGAKIDYKAKYQKSQQVIKDNYAKFEVPYLGKDNDDYVNGQGFCCDDSKTLKSFAANANDNPELYQYYYHSDHLGSSSLITNLDGDIVQHIEYAPFGEVFIEERNNTWNTPYLFNAKELDEETGLYYYGARYYDPRISLWLSTDPLQEKYPNISTYAYTFQNPVKFLDPNGLEGWPITRAWSRSDIVEYAKFAQKKIQEYKDNGIKEDCADFAVRLIVEYASEKGLPLVLKNRWGKEFDAKSNLYKDYDQYLTAAKIGIQAADLPLNSYEVEWSETQSGDFQIIQYTRHRSIDKRFEHTAIFENIDNLVYGNFPADKLQDISPKYWTNGPKNKTVDDWYLFSGKNNSRWNVLNPINMLPEPSIQKIKSQGISLLKADPTVKIPEIK